MSHHPVERSASPNALNMGKRPAPYDEEQALAEGLLKIRKITEEDSPFSFNGMEPSASHTYSLIGGDALGVQEGGGQGLSPLGLPLPQEEHSLGNNLLLVLESSNDGGEFSTEEWINRDFNLEADPLQGGLDENRVADSSLIAEQMLPELQSAQSETSFSPGLSLTPPSLLFIALKKVSNQKITLAEMSVGDHQSAEYKFKLCFKNLRELLLKPELTILEFIAYVKRNTQESSAAIAQKFGLKPLALPFLAEIRNADANDIVAIISYRRRLQYLCDLDLSALVLGLVAGGMVSSLNYTEDDLKLVAQIRGLPVKFFQVAFTVVSSLCTLPPIERFRYIEELKTAGPVRFIEERKLKGVKPEDVEQIFALFRNKAISSQNAQSTLPASYSQGQSHAANVNTGVSHTTTAHYHDEVARLPSKSKANQTAFLPFALQHLSNRSLSIPSSFELQSDGNQVGSVKEGLNFLKQLMLKPEAVVENFLSEARANQATEQELAQLYGLPPRCGCFIESVKNAPEKDIQAILNYRKRLQVLCNMDLANLIVSVVQGTLFNLLQYTPDDLKLVVEMRGLPVDFFQTAHYVLSELFKLPTRSERLKFIRVKGPSAAETFVYQRRVGRIKSNSIEGVYQVFTALREAGPESAINLKALGLA